MNQNTKYKIGFARCFKCNEILTPCDDGNLYTKKTDVEIDEVMVEFYTRKNPLEVIAI